MMMQLAVSHKEIDCERDGNFTTFYTHNSSENYAHRRCLMQFFKNLVSANIAELTHYYNLLQPEILQRTEGRASYRTRALCLYYENQARDFEEYGISLERSNLDYHSKLIEYDDKFTDRATVITDEESNMPPEEIEVIINVRFQERKKTCTLMFREHLAEMNKIREEMRLHWEQERHSIAVLTEINPIIEPAGHGGRKLLLRNPLEHLWKE